MKSRLVFRMLTVILILSVIMGFLLGQREFAEKAELKSQITRIKTIEKETIRRQRDSLVVIARDSLVLLLHDSTVYDTVKVIINEFPSRNRSVDIVVRTNYPLDSPQIRGLDHFLNHIQNHELDINVPFFSSVLYTGQNAVRYYDDLNIDFAIMIRDSLQFYTSQPVDLKKSFGKPSSLIEVDMLTQTPLHPP